MYAATLLLFAMNSDQILVGATAQVLGLVFIQVSWLARKQVRECQLRWVILNMSLQLDFL
jgi:hypothetical protein